MGIGEERSGGEESQETRMRRADQSPTSPAMEVEVDCRQMLAMQSAGGRRPHGWDGRFWPAPPPEHDFKPDGRILNWASVASWFMRPEGRSLHPENVIPPTVCTSIRCTVPGCSCECFTPGKLHIRYCESCSHGWVPHALDKLGFRPGLGTGSVEPVQVNVAFDIASLVLYGCQALPIRLKILLDRLFSVLQREEVVQVLRGFGWTQEDYARGYILQEPHGAVLDRWNICSPEEEPLVLQQFLRFGETRAITQQLLLHGVGDGRYLPRMEADIKKYLERAPGRPPLKDDRAQKMHMPRPTQQLSPQQQKPPPPPPFKLPPTGLTCTPAPPPTSSPPTSMASTNSLTVSPLNRLQNMQPFDFRKIGKSASPDDRKKPEEQTPPGLMNLCVSSSASPVCLPPPPPIPSQPQFGHKSPSAEYYHNSSEFGSEDDEDDDENSQSALNLSRDASNLMRVRPGHNRKNTTPVKRQWGSTPLPLNLGTQLINPTTGKKRVQCNVCLKTFCDKGALKIHFSAVHLREMHKCTVEGCNMMFSSRRSRNRHSANPNPKLHSPHLRRKISPHDGRTAQNHPILIPPLPAGLNPLTFGTFPLLTPPPELRQQAAALDLKQSLDLSAMKHEDMRKSDHSEHMDDYMIDDDDEDGIVVEGTGDSDGDSDNHNSEKQENSPAKRFKVSESDGDMDEDVISNMDSNEDSLSVVDSQSIKEENGPENLVTKSSRKRKNRNPTRCAVSQSISHNDNAISDEDSSNNLVYRSHDLRTTKCEEKSEDLSIKKCDEEHENNNTIKKNDDNPQESSICNHYENKEGLNLSMNESKNDEPENYTIKKNDSSEEEIREEKPRPSSRNGDSHRSEESIDSSNALRQLENLSQGHFGDISRQQDYSMKYSDQDPPSPARSRGSSISSNEDLGSDDPDMQGYFNDGIDVPIDKDNPRMCTACGKVFQNHFGVKTHYQNVHLKLMHKCTVDGCNAAFPSKRSRDRHSANLNLHRKLLSTSLTDKSGMFLDPSHLSTIAANPALHTEFLARLYADTGNLPPLPPPLLNGDRLHPLPFLHPLGFPPFLPHLNGRSSGSVSPASAPSPHLAYADDDVDRTPDREGLLPCRFCSQSLKDAGSLREHYEAHHLAEMHRCTVSGCNLVFASSKRRNAHAEDEQAHKKT